MSLPESSEVSTHVKNQVATITLCRPQKGNSLTPTLVSSILQFLNQYEKDPHVRVVVITGKGKYFCSGMDFTSQSKIMGDGDKQNDEKVKKNEFLEVLNKLKTYPKVTIARVNGPIFGGGIGLLFACDLIVSTKQAFFSFAEVKRGLVPAMISISLIPLLGPSISKQYMLTGAKLTAERALKLGLFYKVAENIEDLEKLIDETVEEIILGGPNAQKVIKELIQLRTSNIHNEGECLRIAEKIFLDILKGKEAQYGIQCFLSKEKPDWSTLSKL